ncbi:hypothetical protein PVAND_007067 [Polypedilum vanderplanki]|uniref:Dynein regulatory complex protein 10 n=1 Tax=Polypedilum vanderplanki TaxID=319348 RepID=A0A9J6C5J9_POLVA|nr:hypothetical protein PVAND_007067 [Polypedilum vanderplanki]
MSEKNKDSLFEDENVLNFFKDTSLGKFLNENLSVSDIDQKLLAFGEAQTVIDDEPESDFDKRVNLIINVINKAFDEMNLILNDESLIDSHQFPSVKVFREYLNKYVKQITHLLKETESQRLKKIEIVRKIQRKIEIFERKIKTEVEKSKHPMKSLPEHYKSKIDESKELLAKMKELKQDANDDFHDYKFALITKIMKKEKNHEVEMKNLLKKENSLEAAYKNLLTNNKSAKKNMLEQKLKAEQALEAILLKFDNDIGSRVDEIEAIEGEIDAEKKKFELWKSTICVRQEAEYTRLMQEKEEEEARERAERLEQIRREHAAKVIQVGWRKYNKKRKKELMKQSKKTKNKKGYK